MVLKAFQVWSRASLFKDKVNYSQNYTAVTKDIINKIKLYRQSCSKYFDEQIFYSPQVKQIVTISNKMVYTSCHTSCRMTWPLKDWRGAVCPSLLCFSQEWILGKGNKSHLSQKFHWNCSSCSEDMKVFFV